MQGTRYAIGVAAADYDNDGHQDLFVTGANGYQLFHNNGNGTFTGRDRKRRPHSRPPRVAQCVFGQRRLV